MLNVFKYLDTDSIRKCTTLAKELYETWLIPELWECVDSEEEYFDTRVLEILDKYTNRVLEFKVKYKHEYQLNKPLNHVLFSMYNVVKLILAGCEIITNVDFLQVMYQLRYLDVSECPSMSTASLIRSVPTVGTLDEFICRGNDVRVSAFSIYQCVRDLYNLEKIDMCDSGTMRPWLARKICRFCMNLKTFYFTTFWSLDNDASKVSWYKLVKRKYPHVTFTQKVIDKVSEYMTDCRPVKHEVMLDEWADVAVEVNPDN